MQLSTWNDHDDADLPEADVVPGDIFVGHPDVRWTKIFRTMVTMLDENAAREMAEEQFPAHQLTRIRTVDGF